MFLRLKKFKYLFVIGAAVLLFIANSGTFAMESSNYIINWDSINAGGTDNSESDSYKVRDTLGQMGPGKSDSASWTMRAGYRQVNEEPKQLSFSVNAQNENTKISYSSFDSANFTVTVSDASEYSVDDYIGVVENEGPAQLVAVGKATGIAGNVITVDKWSGDQAGMSATPSGADDYVYKMDTHTIYLGELTSGEVSTGVAMTEITTNAPNGYEIYVTENHGLQLGEGPQTIDDVADGAVTAGSEEYGIETTGDNAQGSGDWAITESNQTAASSTDRASEQRIGVIYKASIDPAKTAGGVYTHLTRYYALANF